MSSVQALRAELAALRNEVRALTDRVIELESQVGFELVGGISSTAEPPEDWRGTEIEIKAEDTEGRRKLAEGIGRFLRRAVDGDLLGSSGREKLKLQNRCYLVIADYEGRLLPSPLFTTSFQEVRGRCKRGPELERSIFVGLATKWEARVALEAGRFEVPLELRDA